MLRKLHSISGLMATLLVVMLGITGATLAVKPILERAQSVVVGTSAMSVAELAGNISARYPGVEQIQRKPSGNIIVYYSFSKNEGEAGGQITDTGAVLVNPISGETLGDYSTSPFMGWVKNLHRSYLLDTPGRLAAGFGAFLMLLLTVSGCLMLVKRLGGWGHLLRPIQGSFKTEHKTEFNQRLHSELGRIAILAMILSASTGLYMSAITFELLPEAATNEPAFPEQVAGGKPMSVNQLKALENIPVAELRELVYPYPGDINDVYSIKTNQGSGFIDQASGELLNYQAYSFQQNFNELMYTLHTGEGLWWLALLLGLAALTVPFMAVTGVFIWWQRTRSAITLANNAKPQLAEAIILVGSESNSTWGFAKALHDALFAKGILVHTAPMNRFKNIFSDNKNCRNATQMFILTATYGDGAAPASADQFLAQLEKLATVPNIPVAVLGFGDRQFPQFCHFAKQVEALLIAKSWPQLLPLDTINRQSAQEFHRWGEAVSGALDKDLALSYLPELHGAGLNRLKTVNLELTNRDNYGEAVQAPTAILRFSAKNKSLPKFEAGDLVGILPPGDSVPRFYSLASSSADGALEICVRQQPNGLCSNYLHALAIGGTIDAFIQPNPTFRPLLGNSPIILVAAGTGIAPLVGFIRHNIKHRPMYLYWGGRNPHSDFLYEPELNQYLSDKRLTELNAVFSRTDKQQSDHGYVQDKLMADSDKIRHLISGGAQVLVCGGRSMSKSVAEELDNIIAPLELDVAKLKAQGLYREDVY